MERTASNTSDGTAIAAMHDVIETHRNPTSWYNNASFALPLAGAIIVGVAGLALRRADILGFAGFLFAVTLCMVPVVLASWRHTATVVVLDREHITSLHNGTVLKELRWDEVTAISRRETQGNVRWLVASRDGERLLLDGEIEDLDGLLQAARRLTGLS